MATALPLGRDAKAAPGSLTCLVLETGVGVGGGRQKQVAEKADQRNGEIQ